MYWTAEEKEIMHKEFKKNLEDRILPSLNLCNEIREKHKVLQHRNAATMKAWINNSIKKMKVWESRA